MDKLDDVIESLKQLRVDQQHLVSNLIEELSTNNQTRYISANNNRIPNSSFISNNNIPLSIGDTVRVLNSRKTGKEGDNATILKFNKLYVAIRLTKNGSITQRASKNLEYIEE